MNKNCKLYFYTGNSGAGKSAKLIELYYHYKNKNKDIHVLKSFPGYMPYHFGPFAYYYDQIKAYNSEDGKCRIYSRNGRNINSIFLTHFLKSNKEISNNKKRIFLLDSVHHAKYDEFLQLIDSLSNKDILYCFGMRDYLNDDPYFSKDVIDYLFYNADDINVIKGGNKYFIF